MRTCAAYNLDYSLAYKDVHKSAIHKIIEKVLSSYYFIYYEKNFIIVIINTLFLVQTQNQRNRSASSTWFQ